MNGMYLSPDKQGVVLARDNQRCVVCEGTADEVCSILDLRLWDTFTFDAHNWVSLCATHAAAVKNGLFHPAELRSLARIDSILVPAQCYQTFTYDRWGNQILSSGERVRGELFHASDVQDILAKTGKSDSFVQWAKYPRTFLLPWVDAVSEGDRIMTDTKALHGKRVIVTEKMDGENITIYRDYFHGRSVDGPSHPSRNWLREFLNQLSIRIPTGVRVCGEYLFARHAIEYRDLESYFLSFSAWTALDECLSWDDSVQLFSRLGVSTVPVLYDGVFEQQAIHEAWREQCSPQSEGYIVRSADAIRPDRFRHLCGKFIRSDYTQADTIQLNRREGRPVVPNGLLSPTLLDPS